MAQITLLHNAQITRIVFDYADYLGNGANELGNQRRSPPKKPHLHDLPAGSDAYILLLLITTQNAKFP